MFIFGGVRKSSQWPKIFDFCGTSENLIFDISEYTDWYRWFLMYPPLLLRAKSIMIHFER